jgi:hypothetical protein
LLDSLTAKITAEGEKEAKAYKEFFDWCDGRWQRLASPLVSLKASPVLLLVLVLVPELALVLV